MWTFKELLLFDYIKCLWMLIYWYAMVVYRFFFMVLFLNHGCFRISLRLIYLKIFMKILLHIQTFKNI